MMTLVERIEPISELSPEEVEHLRSLCASWQLLADLSFSDLLLHVCVSDEEVFEICAQVRPLTSQTLYPKDLVGKRVTQPEQPVVERAFREGRPWSQDEPVLVDGVPVRMDAVPVRFNGKVIAVLSKEGSPAISRRLGRLEEVYLNAAQRISTMICEGWFPYRNVPLGEWPRVGEGLFVLDETGVIFWASPNAVSSLHRLGVNHNVYGQLLDELGVGETPARHALKSLVVMDGELVRGDTHVRLRVLPLMNEQGSAAGALVLARDISELREKERLILVKDATIREIHHRVKNNLQTIASLLRLQGRRLASEEARAALQESELRIGSIALVHETLSEAFSDLAEFGEIARRIARLISDGLVFPKRRIEVKVTGSTGPLGATLATPLAVALAELMQNSVEHAFPDGRSGTIGVELSKDADELAVIVWDDGVGIPEGVPQGARLGLQIVRSLVEELGGHLALSSNGGTRAEIRLPAREMLGEPDVTEPIV